MRAVFVVTFYVCVCLALSGCASGLPEVSFSKAGITPDQRQQDSVACWDYALNSPEGREEVPLLDTARGAGAILGGPLAIAYTVAKTSDEKEMDPKKVQHNWMVHNTCMQRKGYKLNVESW